MTTPPSVQAQVDKLFAVFTAYRNNENPMLLHQSLNKAMLKEGVRAEAILRSVTAPDFGNDLSFEHYRSHGMGQPGVAAVKFSSAAYPYRSADPSPVQTHLLLDVADTRFISATDQWLRDAGGLIGASPVLSEPIDVNARLEPSECLFAFGRDEDSELVFIMPVAEWAKYGCLSDYVGGHNFAPGVLDGCGVSSGEMTESTFFLLEDVATVKAKLEAAGFRHSPELEAFLTP
jgi:hypothetical protein